MTENTEDDDYQNSKKLMFFGRDLAQIPCFRSSFLYGIAGGVVTGFGTFLFTSRPKISAHAGVGIFCITTLGYWSQCRYNWSKTNFEYKKMKRGLQDYAMHEGTELGDELQKRASEV
ncbi:cytochrome c oxidase assembly protein COX20, mitochondrial [Phlebotomus argentipes]|uniref:cytochrome c oxidase assembly protein COX20, mitochondrial n=1 Tax=Phlebotomus argentipes TaxID=94469 RepID=UPI002892DD55|nr:cytochrome c oxidase assembly protein COX20, mitochondrial [Phlebotomus argentipes]